VELGFSLTSSGRIRPERLALKWHKGCRACTGRTCLRQKAPERHQHLVQLLDDGGFAGRRNSRTRAPTPACRQPQRDRRRRATSRSRGRARTISRNQQPLVGRARPAGIRRCGPAFPIRQGAPKVTFSADRCLVAFLRRLAAAHDDCRDSGRTCFDRSAGGTGCLAMWQCTHSSGFGPMKEGCRSAARKGSRRVIEVAPRIDGPIHRPVCSGHVGERPGDELGRLRRLAFAEKPRGDSKPRSQPCR